MNILFMISFAGVGICFLHMSYRLHWAEENLRLLKMRIDSLEKNNWK